MQRSTFEFLASMGFIALIGFLGWIFQLVDVDMGMFMGALSEFKGWVVAGFAALGLLSAGFGVIRHRQGKASGKKVRTAALFAYGQIAVMMFFFAHQVHFFVG